jgi:hypothetical protein
MYHPSEVNEDNLRYIRRDASGYFRNKKREYLKDKINEFELNSKSNNIRDLYRGITEFRKGYQPKTNLINDERGDHLVDSQKTVTSWKNYIYQIFNVQGPGGIRQTEIHTAEPFVPRPSAAEVEVAIRKLKIYKEPGSDHIPAKLIESGEGELCVL